MDSARRQFPTNFKMSFPTNFKMGHVERPLNIWKFSLKWGWVFLERTRVLSGIQFTTHFIEFFVVETKRFVSSSVHVILTRQTCGQVVHSPRSRATLDLGLLYILILRTYSKFARKNNFLALGVCFPQFCSSAGRRFAALRSRVQNYRRIVSFPQQKDR